MPQAPAKSPFGPPRIASTPEAPPQKCSVDEADGKAVVHFHIDDPMTLTRLKRRAGQQDLATFLWENIIRRGIETAAY